MYQWLRELIKKDTFSEVPTNLLVGEIDWISVDDKMPESNDLCWVRVEYINLDTNNKTIREFEGEFKKNGYWLCSDPPYFPNHSIRVTHWILRKGVK